jgi:hypothetical protein
VLKLLVPARRSYNLGVSLDLDEICMQRLTPGESLGLRDASGCTITCCAGMVWITREGDSRDIFLAAGQSFTIDGPGLALIHAMEGMKDEWMSDSGITVISLPLRFRRRLPRDEAS